MFRVKICGVSRIEDVRAVAEAGADAVGLNFYPHSRRYLPLEAAAALLADWPRGLLKVGLFVNAPIEQVRATASRLALDLIQLHGDETPEVLAELSDLPLMRALRVGPEGLTPVFRYLESCERRACLPRLVLLDSHVAGSYGGSGQTGDWDALASYPRDGSLPPLVLAGGLTPENVDQAIRAVHPRAVDTASGVERDGYKSPDLIRRFVAAARAAME